jgi:beta-lactamase class D
VLVLLFPLGAHAQRDLKTPFRDCQAAGSTTVYDYKRARWIFSDSADAHVETLPASTFKVINLLIALQTGTIRDENEVVKWVGSTDTVRYGYRPDIYRDLTVKEAFELSAGWVFVELAKRIGRDTYRHYLARAGYGNGQLSEADPDFWNIGAFGISPVNQINFLKAVYENKALFSRRNLAILKRVMCVPAAGKGILRAKTGWTRDGGRDVGWWVGYVEHQENTYFFATRLVKSRQSLNPGFGECRKEITRRILRQLDAL